jgi:integrase/recombinase XerD
MLIFRHTVAQAVMETTGNLKVAQELLGHAQVTTTADLYMHVDERMLVDALLAVRSRTGAAGHQPGQVAPVEARAPERYAFAYDPMTIKELEGAALKQPPEGNREDTTEPAAALDSGRPGVQPG